MQPKFVIVMGVAGSGKTALGGKLAAALGWDFYDADDYHSNANVAKMGQGVPLTDEDRAGWLASLRELVMHKPGPDVPAAVRDAFAEGIAGLTHLSATLW